MLQLANILYSKGFSISIIHTSFNSPNPSNYPHFTFHSICEGLAEIAESLKLLRVVLRTGSASSFLAFAAFPLLRERGYLPIQDSQLEEPVVEFPHLKVEDLPVIDTSNP
nr:UDP-glycosyltransferase 76B1-like [Ziziphus jujuba var. spinosa]